MAKGCVKFWWKFLSVFVYYGGGGYSGYLRCLDRREAASCGEPRMLGRGRIADCGVGVPFVSSGSGLGPSASESRARTYAL